MFYSFVCFGVVGSDRKAVWNTQSSELLSERLKQDPFPSSPQLRILKSGSSSCSCFSKYLSVNNYTSAPMATNLTEEIMLFSPPRNMQNNANPSEDFWTQLSDFSPPMLTLILLNILESYVISVCSLSPCLLLLFLIIWFFPVSFSREYFAILSYMPAIVKLIELLSKVLWILV